jgi:hypothetical protein
MAWERRHGRRYFYQSIRVGGKVRHVYLGTGPAARLAAARLELKAAAKEALVNDRKRWQAALAPARRFAAEMDRWLTLALQTEGYHRHYRGVWTRKGNDDVINIDPPPDLDPMTLDRFNQVAARVRDGDEAAKAELRALMTEHPQWYRCCGPGFARTAWLDFAAAGDPVVAMAMKQNLDDLAAELVRPGASRLEKLLAARVALCQLMTDTADTRASTASAATPAVRREAMARQRQAHGMLVGAARSLGNCQRLTPPPSPLDLLRPQEIRQPARQRGQAGSGRRFE